MSSGEKWFLLVNPSSGGGRGKKLWPSIKHELEQQSFDFEFKLTEYPRHSQEIIGAAISDGFRRFIAVGGDGTMHELVNARNQADALIHGTEKSLKELGDKVDPAEKSKVEGLISELREAVKGDDKELIEKKTQELMEASGSIAQAAANANAGGADAGAAGSESASSAGDDDVVDAEFEEVDDDKK